jgi:CTP-dependent riboflavin kinase
MKLGSRIVTGEYVPGLGHSQRRPKLYRYLGTFRGTINIQHALEMDDALLIPNEIVEAQDQCDVDEKQDFLVRRCKLNGVEGYQILPFDRVTSVARGHHAFKKIEVTLKEEIKIQHGDRLDVELLDFED